MNRSGTGQQALSRNGDPVNDFQIGDRVKLVETDREDVIIGRCYGDVRYEVRCDNGTYVRDLPPEALRLIEQSPTLTAASSSP